MTNTNTDTRQAAEAIAEALYANNYREHSGEWYKQIDSEGCGLTAAEQV